MRVLFVASELAPLSQSGGLGDAVSGLARALGDRGHDVTCLIPAYRSALQSPACPALVDVGPVRIGFPGFELWGRILTGELFPNVDVELVDLPALYDRAGLYGEGGHDYDDNALRFIALSRAAAYRAEATQPDVVVAHDWHAALTVCLLRTSLDRGPVRGVACVQVVHNNAHQGRVGGDSLGLTSLAPDLLHPDGLEAWGSLCLLKGGLMWADRIIAVSPTYAREVQHPAFGEGLDGAYRSRAHRLLGIRNGIDTLRYDPETDLTLGAPYSARSLAGKAACRAALLAQTKIEAPPPGLLLCAVGRLAAQKGWDVLLAAIDGLLDLGASFVLLGDGDRALARALEAKALQHPRRIWFRAAYDEALSRRIYAGSDAVLIPSRFEPCGLVQLIAQRYGTLPVAHATGGLLDTIVDPMFHARHPTAGEEWSGATGVLFSPLSADALIGGVRRVARLGATGGLPAIQSSLLALEVGWDGPAQAWEAVLTDVAAEARRRI